MPHPDRIQPERMIHTSLDDPSRDKRPAQEDRRVLLLGAGVVMLGATLLILRANVPRWLFGAPYNVDERSTVAVFIY